MSSPRGLTGADRLRARSALVTELARAEEQSIALAHQFDDIVGAAELSNTDDEHDPEGTTIAFERAQSRALLAQAQLDVEALQLTLARVDDPNFGTCEQCGGPIGIERLIALPATARCVECAR